MWLAELIQKAFGENPLLALALGAVAFLVIAVIIVLWSKPLVPFLYAGARVSARSARMIPEAKYQALLASTSVSELSSQLEQSDYAGILQTHKGEDSSLISLHTDLEKKFIQELNEVSGFATDKLAPVFDAFFMLWETKIVKTFCRSKLTGRELDSDLVYPVGEIDEALLEKLENAQTIQDVGAVMAGTKYAKVFEKDFTDPWELEADLDNFILSYFTNITTKTKMYDGKFIRDMLSARFDIISLIMTLKEGVVKTDKRIIKTGTAIELALKDFKAENEREKHLVSTMRNSVFGDALQKGYEGFVNDGHYYHFEVELYRAYLHLLKKHEFMHYQGPFPVYLYLVRKEYEMKNLVALTRGIESEFNAEEMRELIIQ